MTPLPQIVRVNPGGCGNGSWRTFLCVEGLVHHLEGATAEHLVPLRKGRAQGSEHGGRRRQATHWAEEASRAGRGPASAAEACTLAILGLLKLEEAACWTGCLSDGGQARGGQGKGFAGRLGLATSKGRI